MSAASQPRRRWIEAARRRLAIGDAGRAAAAGHQRQIRLFRGASLDHAPRGRERKPGHRPAGAEVGHRVVVREPPPVDAAQESR